MTRANFFAPFLLALSACVTADTQMSREDAIRATFDPSTRLILSDRGAPVVSEGVSDIESIAVRATRDDVQTLLRQRGADRVSIRQVPFLLSAPEGQSYMLAESPKALVQAEPALMCPVRSQIRVEGETATAQDAVSIALTRCHEQLSTLGLGDDCDCRVLAHDDVLLASLDDFEYARDLPARIFIDGSLQSERYLVREVFIEPEGRGLHITGSAGLFAEVNGVVGGPVSGTLTDGTTLTGVFEVSGLSRGRNTGVLTLSRPDGGRIRVVVGP